ncbi:hypothetical protein GCM10020000_81210 [Streptomyces olivoverticillatus]
MSSPWSSWARASWLAPSVCPFRSSCRRCCLPWRSPGGSAEQFWGQGYASEAAQATLEFALQDRGLDRVIGIVRAGDEASENVLRKLGMVPERETVHPVYGFPLHVHSIDLTEFQA